MSWSLSCLSQRRSWKKSIKFGFKKIHQAHWISYVSSVLLIMPLNRSLMHICSIHILLQVWWWAGEGHAGPHISAFIQDDEGKKLLFYSMLYIFKKFPWSFPIENRLSIVTTSTLRCWWRGRSLCLALSLGTQPPLLFLAHTRLSK